MILQNNYHYITDHFIQFGECLGKTKVELRQIWEEVLGRYERAVQHLVVDVLHKTSSPVKTLVNALREMTVPECAQRAAETILKGQFTQTSYCNFE